MYRPSFAPATPAAQIFCFSLQAEAEPGIMPRVLELFAKRGLVPNRWISDLCGARNRDLSIDIQIGDMSPETADYMAQCLRQIPGVQTVLTSRKGGAVTGAARA